MSFATKTGKKLSNKYSQNLLDSAERSGTTKIVTDAVKTASKRIIQKIAEGTGDLIGNKITGKIKTVSKTSQNNLEAIKSEEDISKER